jgi:hypothetical protein
MITAQSVNFVKRKNNMNKIDLSNKLFEVVKVKTDIRGFWKDETGKLYREFIRLFSCEFPLDIENKINDLFFLGEKAIFIRGKQKAFILSRDENFERKQDVLRSCHSFFIEKGKLRASLIKKLLKEYGGLTAFKLSDGYLLESWTV